MAVLWNRSRIKNLGRDQHGGVLIFIGLAISVLIISVGVAIDMGRVMLARSAAMSALDASVLGAAAVSGSDATPEEIEATAKQYFYANFPAGYLGVDSELTNLETTVDKANGAVEGNISLGLPTYFGNFLNVSNVEINLNSQVQRVAGDKNVEIALALDVTPSMCFNNLGEYSLAACSANKGKLKALRDSVATMVKDVEDAIASSGNKAEAYYSFVPFIHTVKINDKVADDHFYWSKVTGLEKKIDISYLPTMRGLGRDGTKIVSDLDGVIAKMKNFGGTNTAIGTYWAWLSLRQASVGKFIGTSSHQDASKHPVELNNKDTFKIMIMLTDGSNTYLELNVDTNEWEPYHDVIADHDQTQLCKQIQKEGIEIFAIAFDVPNDADGDKIRQIFRDDCAQESSKPKHYFEPKTPDELKDVFKKIASYLIDLRITK